MAACRRSRGSFCFRVSTSAHRSPTLASRASAASGSKVSDAISRRRTARRNSSQVTGIETYGSDRLARSE